MSEANEIEVMRITFRRGLPKASGQYLVLEEAPKAGADEYFCNPYLCRINVEGGNAWVQYSVQWSSMEMTPRDWHPIPSNCQWFFSPPINRILFLE